VPDGTRNRYDVFVSYAQENNETPLGSTAQYGWVTMLTHNLNTGPGHLRKNLFIDHQLKAGDAFSDDLVRTVGNSTLLLQQVRAILQQAHCGIRSLPQHTPLSNNGIDIVQVLQPCHAGITIFADSAKRDTVFNRLSFFLNQIAEFSLPVARWAIYVTPRTVGCDLGLASDDLVAIDEQQLTDFVQELDQ